MNILMMGITIVFLLNLNSIYSQVNELSDYSSSVSFENSIGFSGNLTFLTMNDLRPNKTENKVSYNSISLIGNSKIIINGGNIINVRLSLNYSPYTLSNLSLGNYTFRNNNTDEIKILPLSGILENENISLVLGLGSEIRLYKSIFLRGHILQLETVYNNKLNLNLDSDYSGYTGYNTEKERIENVEIFNCNNEIDLLVSFGASLFYSFETNKALVTKIDIELGVLLKTFQYEEFDHVSQIQLSLLLFN